MYALEGSVAYAGSTIQWLRDNLKIVPSASSCEAQAQEVPDSAGVVFVPALSGLLCPYWRPEVRGSILGLSAYHTAAHIVRAALESTAFQTLDVLRAMLKDLPGAGGGGRDEKRGMKLKVDGGKYAWRLSNG